MADLRSELKRLKDLLSKSEATQSVERRPMPKNLSSRRPSESIQTQQSAQRAIEAPKLTALPLQNPSWKLSVNRRTEKSPQTPLPHNAVPNRSYSTQAPPKAVTPKTQATATKAEPLIHRPLGVEKHFRPLPKGQLTRQQLFKYPEPWVALGSRTQLGQATLGRFVDIVIGLDFGTSYTKAAVGFMDKIFPVSWDGVSKCAPNYLLPSEYTAMEVEDVFIGQHVHASQNNVQGDLKLPFINPAVSIASIAGASIFLALTIRYIRAWVYKYHADKIGNAKIRWQLNIGAPSNGLETKRLETAYRTLASTAWIRSQSNNLTRVAECKSTVWQDGQVLEDLADLQIRPEFVAQMAGYMQSPKRQKGLHALVDVGGGTLDVVTFIVHKIEDEDTFPFLVPEVHPLGTHGLLQNRLVGLPASDKFTTIDELQPIPEPQEFSEKIGVALHQVATRDRIFGDEIRSVIRTVFEVTKSRRYRLADAWTLGVRTFFTGGGSSVELYRQATLSAKVHGANGLQLMPLPPHPKLDGFEGNETDYQRISVACGLAQDSFTLGRVVPAKEVEDDRPTHAIHRERLDRDDLYAR